MNRILKTITTVSLCFILVGFSFAGCGWLLGGTFEFAYIPAEHRFVTSKDTNYHYMEEKVDTFTNINIDADKIDIIIVTGDSYSISFPENENYKTTYTVENGTLNVQSNTTKNLFLFSFMIDATPYEKVLTITVPKGTNLDSLFIANDSGDCDIKGQTCDDILIDADYGDVSLLDTTANVTKITMASGSLKLSDSKLNTADLSLEYGDCTIIDSSVEQIEYAGDSGFFLAKKLVTKQATISLDYGDCDISDSSINKLKAELSSGDCEIKLTGSKESYTINLDVDMGDINVDGHKTGGQYTADNQKDNIIDITNDYGDIDLSFDN